MKKRVNKGSEQRKGKELKRTIQEAKGKEGESLEGKGPFFFHSGASVKHYCRVIHSWRIPRGHQSVSRTLFRRYSLDALLRKVFRI